MSVLPLPFPLRRRSCVGTVGEEVDTEVVDGNGKEIGVDRSDLEVEDQFLLRRQDVRDPPHFDVLQRLVDHVQERRQHQRHGDHESKHDRTTAASLPSVGAGIVTIRDQSEIATPGTLTPVSIDTHRAHQRSALVVGDTGVDVKGLTVVPTGTSVTLALGGVHSR